MRALCLGLVFLLGAGCATNGSLPHRTAPKVILGALIVGSAAVAIGSAVKSRAIENDLASDYKTRMISGSEFASRDAQGQRWNRIGRASAFVGAISVLGLGVLWEMSLNDHAAVEPTPPNNVPLFPLPASLTLPSPTGFAHASANAQASAK